jgi:FixJ family two-component response regulator
MEGRKSVGSTIDALGGVMSTAVVVYVVDDDPSFRTAVTRMLTAAGLSVRSYASGTDLLADLSGNAATEGAGCVLADLCMPGIDGLQLQQACSAAGVALPFVFLTGQGDVPSAVSAMRRGAVDFLDKCAPRHALLGSLKQAIERDAEARSARAQRERLDHRFAALTRRELEVLGQVVHGRMNKQIAAALGIHERTVKLHRNAITTKVGVRSVAELTTLTRESGLFAEPRQSCP